MKVAGLHKVHAVSVDAPDQDGAVDPLSFLPDQGPTDSVAPATTLDDIDLPDQASPVEQNHSQLANTDPDRNAKIMNLSKQTGQPPQFVDKNLQGVEKLVSAPGPGFFADLDKNYPGTSTFLAKPENMAVAHDDMPNVAQHEAQVQGITQAHSMLDEAKAAWQHSLGGLITGGKPTIEPDPNAPWYDKFASIPAGLLGDVPFMAVGGIAGALGGGSVAGPPGAFVVGAAGGFGAPAAVKKGILEHYQKGDIQNTDDLLNRTGDILKEFGKQTAVGLLAEATGGTASVLAGKAGASAATATAARVATEAGALEVGGKGVEGEKPTLSGYIENLLTIGAMHGAGALAKSPAPAEVAKTENSREFLNQIEQTAVQSKLKARSPEAYQEHLAALTEDTPVKDAFIPIKDAETYFQSKGIDPAAAMAELGASDSYAEAQKTGGDIQIPFSTFVEKLAGTEHFQGLADDVKFSPDDLTAREVATKHGEIQAQMKAMEDKRQEDGAIQAESDEIQSHIDKGVPALEAIRQKLVDAGIPVDQAKYSAQVHEAFFKTLGDRYGIDPNELAQRFPLEVNNKEVIPGDAGADGEGDRVAAQAQDGKSFDQAGPIENDLQTSHTIAETVRSPEIKSNESITNLGPKEVRAKAFEYAKSKGARKSVINEHTGWKVDVSSDGLKKSANYATRPEQALGLENIHSLIENATYLRSAPDRGGNENIQHNYLYSPFESDGKHYIAKIDVIENLKGPREGKQTLYTLHVQETKEPAGIVSDYRSEVANGLPSELPPAGVQSNFKSEAELPQSGERTLSKADLLARVNEARQTTELFQDDGTPRGRIQINGRDFNIDLFKNADKSTFLHETGHYFLEVMGHLAGEENAPADIKRDYAEILKFVGADSREGIGTEQHEKFARAFEAYLREGKAPSIGLRKAFSRFRQWLSKVYEKMTQLNVQLTPEVRGVMDRMLATTKEIERATKLSGYEAVDLPDLPKELRSKIQDFQERARDQAEEVLMKEQMSELTEKHQKFLDERRAELTPKATAEVSDLPIFQAIEDLKSGGESEKPRGPYALAEKGFRGELTHEESVQLEVAAERHGFTDGQDLASKILEARDTNQFEKEVKARVDAGMAEHADLKDTSKIREKALEAVHNSRMTELLALEREGLASLVKDATKKLEVTKRRRIEAKVEAEAAKASAKEILANKPIKDAGNARVYVTAERNAAVRAAKAAAKGDFEAASTAKSEQLMNNALAAEAMRNRTEIAKTLKGVQKYARRGGDMMGMTYGFVRQVDQLLGRYGLADKRTEDSATLIKVAQDMASKGEDPSEIANRTGFKQDQSGKFVPETLSDFVSRVNDNYYAMTLPDSVMASAEKPYKDLSLTELREMKTAVDAIAKTGQSFNRFLGAFEKADIKEAAATLRTSIEQNFGSKYADDMLPGSSHATKLSEMLGTLSRLPDALDRTLDTILTTCNKFDGLKEGPAKEYIYRPFADAQSRKTVRIKDAMKEVDDIFAKHYEPGEFAKYKDTRVDVDGRTFTKEQILSMALNWGNEGNRDRIQRGFGFDDPKMQQVFSHLGKKDWDFAQDTWDHINKYWPEIAKLEMDVNGSEPGKVKPLEFENEHGKYSGGYYPLAYDFEKSPEAFQNNQAKDALYKQYSTAKAATADGHTESRVSNLSRMVRLSLDVLTDHHEDVIHDLEFRRAVIDANRFLMQKDTKAGIVNAVGVKGYAAFGDWLKSVAGGNSEPIGFWEQKAQAFRFRTTFFNLGWRIVSAPKIALENVVNVSSEIGVSGTARALKNYYLGDSGIHETVIEKSSFMQQRAEHLNRDMADITDKYRGEEQSGLKKYAFFVHAYIDQGMSFPLWADAYRRGMADHGKEKLAVSQADEAVKRTFMSGGSVDQPAVMRGNERQKALTTAYGYQSMMWNRFSQQKFQAGMEWAQGNHMAAAAIAARATVYTFAMPAIIGALTRELLHNGQNSNSSDRNKRLAVSALEEATPLKFIPGVRDLASYGIRAAFGEHTGEIHMTPLDEAAQTIIDPIAQVAHGLGGKPLNDRFPEQTANALSLLTGVPRQFNDVTFNFIDWQRNNGELTWRDALTRRTKK